MDRELEIYLHLPFCVRKCLYCDFLSGVYKEEMRGAYVQALLAEIHAVKKECQAYRVSSVFFGGGTPSLLTGGQMLEIGEALRTSFCIAPDSEVTMEGNPGTFTRENLLCYQKAGVNRLSIGCQSADDRELKALGRIHTFEDFQKSYRLARETGFENINVDLMCALPGQNLKSWEETLEKTAALRPEHISAYSLILEEGTPFYEMELALPDEEEERRMYERTKELLAEYGYRQYEISNYALPGKECRHNIGYWQRKNYVGLGLGAASLLENRRFSNTSDMDFYMENSSRPAKIRRDVQLLSKNEQMAEFMFLGLRMTEGISRKRFLENFGEPVEAVYGEILEKYASLGFLEISGDRIFLSREGIGVSNWIFADFL